MLPTPCGSREHYDAQLDLSGSILPTLLNGLHLTINGASGIKHVISRGTNLKIHSPEWISKTKCWGKISLLILLYRAMFVLATKKYLKRRRYNFKSSYWSVTATFKMKVQINLIRLSVTWFSQAITGQLQTILQDVEKCTLSHLHKDGTLPSFSGHWHQYSWLYRHQGNQWGSKGTFKLHVHCPSTTHLLHILKIRSLVRRN